MYALKGASNRVWVNRIILTIAAGILLVIFATSFPQAQGAPGIPLILNHQGRLLNSSGTLLGGPSGTNYCFKFSIYDNATVGQGTKLWPSGAPPSTMVVSVKNGVFNVGIGDTAAGGDTLNFNFEDNDTVFLNVEVADRPGGVCGTFETLGPRQRIVSSAFAINANTVRGFSPSQTPTANQIPVLSGSGHLQLSATNPQVNATGSNTLTLQGGGGTGDIQFFSSSNKITSSGNLTIAGGLTVGSGATITSGGALTVQSTGTNILTLDAGGAAAINIGGTNSNGVNLGRTGQATTVLGTATFNEAVTVGNGSGNDYLGFAAEATNPSCSAGNYRIWASSADNKLKKCQNGTIADLDTGGGGSQTPWTSAIDADGFALQDALNLEFRTAVGSAPAGTVISLYADNSGDLTANVLSAKTFNIAVNGTDEYNFSSTQLDLTNNALTTTGNISTTSTGTITSAGLLTASNGLTLSTGALNLTGTSGSITLTGFGTTAITSTNTTGDANTLTDASFAPAAAASGNLLNLAFTNVSTNGAGTSIVNGLLLSPTQNVTSGAGVHQTNGINLGTVATNTCSAGTCNKYAIYAPSSNNYTDLFNYNGTSLISGTGLINAAQLTGTVPSGSLSGSYTGITGVGTLTAGSLGAGFTTVAVARGGTGVTTFGGTNTILYTTAADTLSSIATANNGVLVTSGTGVPSIAAPGASLSVSSSVLNTIQDIRTTATPQFARIGLGAAADASALFYGSLGSGQNLLKSIQGASETSGVNLIDIATTWNNASNNPTAFKLNVTNTNSGATSKLLDLQIGSVSQLTVSKAGVLSLAGGQSTDITTVSTTSTVSLTMQPAATTTPSTNGGALNLLGGDVWDSGNGGNVNITGGGGMDIGAVGGNIVINAGAAETNGSISISNIVNSNVNIATAAGAKTVTIGNNSSTSLKLKSFSTVNGVLYVNNADGTVAQTAASTAAQCLQTAGAGTAPIWGACGGGGTLQQAYDTGTAGDQVVALDNTQDSVIFRNPNANGTDSAFTVKIDQLATGNVDGLQIASAGTGDGLEVNMTGTGNLADFKLNSVSKFTIANNGGLTINGADSSVVRTTTAQFATGTLSNLTNTGDQLELDDGTVPNSGQGTITTTGQPATQTGGVNNGAISVTRSDGKYYVIRGGTAVDIYDSFAGTFTAGTALGTATGVGVQLIPRPDGRYLLVHGNAGATRTIIDPMQIVAAAADAGAGFCASVGNGSGLFKRPDGKYLVICGNNLATTSIYDPVAGTWAAGPSFTAGTNTIGGGSVLVRPDGRALVINGGATSTTQLYNASSGTANIGVFVAGPSLDGAQTAGTCAINNTAAVSFKRQDGKFVVLSKPNVWTVYDPVANTFTCTATGGPATAMGAGAHVIPMQNYKYLIVPGGAATASYVYDPSVDTFTEHGTPTTAIRAGAHSIMRGDGTWQILVGGGVTTTNNFDTGLYMSGTYTSDDISTTYLNTSSIMRWTAQLESIFTGTNAANGGNTAFSTMQFLVRTATNSGGCTTPLNSATDRELLGSGDLIRAGSTHNCVRITIKFNRPLPKRLTDDRSTWTGGDANTVYRPDYATPTLFDVMIDNSVALHRTNFDFTNPNAGSPAPQTDPSGPTLTRAEGSRVEAIDGHLVLPYGRLTPTTTNGLLGFYNGIMSAAHPNICTVTTEGTVVIQRDDRQFLILSAAAANACLYDPASTTMTAQSGAGNIPTCTIGVGAHAIKRPDGKFLLVCGNGATTNIYDPNAALGSRFAAGPTLSASAGLGSMALLNSDGSYTIVHGGGTTTSSLYNPVRDTSGTLPPGPTLTTAANCGAWAIPIKQPFNNQYKMFVGVAPGVAGVTTTMNYDANTKVFTAGTALTSVAGCGSFTFQRQDGYWLIINAGGGGSGAGLNTTMLLNPFSGTTGAGPTLVGLAQRGAGVIPRADGTFLILHGGNLNTTSLYIPWGGSAANASGGAIGVGGSGANMLAGPTTLTANIAQGSVIFQRPDGKFVIIAGSTTTSQATLTYDAGWFGEGQYLSEQMNVPALAANSTFEWMQGADRSIRIEVRSASSQAALSVASYRSIGRSGQSIGNAGGETWVQVQINFRREFKRYCNARDSVYNSGGGYVNCYVEQSLPTLYWYKINNGMDLMSLQNNGLNVLRVTESGNIYAAPQGGFYSGGADLAENYQSNQTLDFGEVVVGDPDNPENVVRSTAQYQKTILGVVSTAPGFVAGAHTENSFPIALVGRVPVKISTENGPIRAGDYLTSASIPGYAMRATQAGRVIGTALEDFNPANATACMPFGLGASPTTACGKISVFVNLANYSGASVEMLMKEDLAATQTQIESFGLTSESTVIDNLNTDIDPGSPLDTTAQNATLSTELLSGITSPSISSVPIQILSYLEKLKLLKATAQNFSEIFTDRVAAAVEVISPSIYTDGLNVTSISSIKDAITFNNDVIFFGRPYFNQDTAGFAVIKAGDRSVDIAFKQEYLEQPIVNATITLDTTPQEDELEKRDERGTDVWSYIQTARELLEEQILSGELKYIVTKKSARGFTIKLSRPLPVDVQFSWISLAVKQPKIFLSRAESPLSPPLSPDVLGSASRDPYEGMIISEEDTAHYQARQEEIAEQEATPAKDKIPPESSEGDAAVSDSAGPSAAE